MKKRTGLILMLLAMFLGACASKPAPDIAGDAEAPVSERDSLKMGLANLQNGLKAQDEGDMEAARLAFIQAGRHLGQVDAQGREIMRRSLSEVKKVIDISGFEYASRDSFDVLLVYLKMQNAYMDGDLKVLAVLEKQLEENIQKAQETTVKAKQKRLEELSRDVAVKRDEIQQKVQTDVFEVYPTIYVVKKNETLPSIAARHEIYNDSYMWPLIYKANRDQIKDPKVVYVGQDLRIPRDISTDEIVQARREAGAPDPEKIPKDAYTPRRK